MSSFSTSKCVGHVTFPPIPGGWGPFQSTAQPPLSPHLPATPAALEAASSLGHREVSTGWEEKEEGVSRQVCLSHPCKAMEKTEEPMSPMWPNQQEMGRELPETPPSSPSLRGAALRLLQSSPFQRVLLGNTRHSDISRLLVVTVGHCSFLRAKHRLLHSTSRRAPHGCPDPAQQKPTPPVGRGGARGG